MLFRSVGYNNSNGFTGPGVSVDKADPSFRIDSNYGYLKIPLTFPASFLNETNYANNIPVFTVLLSNPNSFKVSTSPTFGSSSKMFEVGLVAETSPGTTAGDKVFSRAQFTPLTYDPSHNLTISWGIKFTA